MFSQWYFDIFSMQVWSENGQKTIWMKHEIKIKDLLDIY